MYKLTLTFDERLAIDFVGNRYFCGHELSDILIECMAEWDEWDHPGDLTFIIPEHHAWAINEGCDSEDYTFPMFGPDLAEKLLKFCFAVV